MPSTRLKVSCVFLILYGVGNILGGLAILVVSLLAKDDIAEMLKSYTGLLSSIKESIFVLLAVLYLMLALLDMLTGISGLRFSGGKGSIRLCQIPAVALILIYGIGALLTVFSGNLPNVVSSLLHAVVALLCIIFCKQVEEENNVKGLMLDETPFFHSRDDQ